jgi:hypothetical protein
MSLTEAEKESLSPEEIAAIEDDSADDEGADTGIDDDAAGKPDDEKAKVDPPPVKTDEKPADQVDDKAKDELKKPDDAADRKPVDTPDTRVMDEDDEPFIPTMKGPPADELAAAKTALDAARKEFDEGNISYDKFDEIKTNHDRLQWKAEQAEEYNKNARDSVWQAEQNRFFRQNPNYRDKPLLNAAYASAVNGILATEEGQKLSDRQVLARAKEQLEAELGIAKPPASATDKETLRRQALAAAKGKNADRNGAGPDLGSAPQARDENDNDEFAWVDRLEGAKYQEALDKMSPEQLERYSSK